MARGEEGTKRHTAITLVGVGFQVALCDFEVILGDDGVQGAFAAGEELAGVAVAVISR